MAGTIIDFTPEAKANEYDADVQALIEAGEGKAYQVTVPLGTLSEKSGEYLNAAKHRRLFNAAANAQGKSARVRGAEKDDKAGTMTYTFVLTDLITRPRKAADSDTPETGAAEEA